MNPDTPNPDDLDAELNELNELNELETWAQSSAAAPLREALATTPPLPGEDGIADRLIEHRREALSGTPRVPGEDGIADRLIGQRHEESPVIDWREAWEAQQRQLRRWRMATGVAAVAALCALAFLILPGPRASLVTPGDTPGDTPGGAVGPGVAVVSPAGPGSDGGEAAASSPRMPSGDASSQRPFSVSKAYAGLPKARKSLDRLRNRSRRSSSL